MLSKKMEKAFNDQIKWEYYSAYLYLSLSSYFSNAGLSGFANWMDVQFQEEQFHARKMFDYVNEKGGRVVLQGIEAPPSTWKTPLAAFDYALRHEFAVTKRINDLMTLAQKENDHASAIFLQWFVSEQVEEEASFGDTVNKLKMVGDGGGMFMLDRELATRVFTPPVA
ncbi:ferritin [Humidesulfovibrio mexicanus]|uniref:Ferritin n=1 Tax=Humidesulfovibrio mexicanus TaxID=147047 RepID=A0A238XUQ0_9BACT|nr:ferritin [Humidesulfovibrio mexicanus]SNR62420.1 ferritin [Humidesulfovibrio mexicanus]